MSLVGSQDDLLLSITPLRYLSVFRFECRRDLCPAGKYPVLTFPLRVPE